MFRGTTTTDSITPFLPCTVIQTRVASRLCFLVDDTPRILSRSFYQKARIKFPAATSSLAPGKKNPSTAGKWCYIEHYAFGLWGSHFLPALTFALGWVPCTPSSALTLDVRGPPWAAIGQINRRPRGGRHFVAISGLFGQVNMPTARRQSASLH